MATETEPEKGPFARWASSAIQNPEKVYRAMFYVAMVFFLFTTLFPFYWLLVLALTPNEAIIGFGFPPTPNGFNPEAFLQVFETVPFHIFMFNSFVLGISTTAIVLVLASLAGYVFGRLDFPGKGILMLIILAVSYFPPAAFIIPLFRVIMPLSAPGVATAGVLTFISVYNEFFFSFLMTSGEADQWAPIVWGILNYQGQYSELYNLMAAASIVGVLPVAILVVVAQEKIVSGLTAGALKE